MEFRMAAPKPGNEKPIMQHILGNMMTEWSVAPDQNTILRTRRPLAVPLSRQPNAGTFFLGGMETTRDELEDYLAEATERNADPKRQKPDRLPEIQRKIDKLRERHGAAIEAAVDWKKKGYKLPKHTPQERKALATPIAVAVEGPNGKLQIVGVRDGRKG